MMQIAVIGGGLMGTGVAQVFAEAGIEVRLWARRHASLDEAMARIARSQEEMRAAGLLPAIDARARLLPTDDLAEALRGVDFVSENVAEDLSLKQRLFCDLERHAPPEAILSTNTSGLSITAIASVTARPERVVGLHWLNPPHLMLPVEVNRGERTSEATMQAVCDLARRAGRIPIRVERDVPGFLWNRLQLALLREAFHIVESGIASAEDVDLAVQWGLGLRWAAVGPLRVADLAGLTIFRTIASALYPHLSAAQTPEGILDEKVERGEGGARDGRGFYAYPPGAHDAVIAERNARLLALRQTLGTP